MQLTDHFSLEELTATSSPQLQDTPDAEAAANLALIAAALEEIRTLLGGKPITINSGYRSVALNAHVGGAADSAHLYGYAADFVCPDFGSPLAICHAIAESTLTFDQLIEEGTWVHLSVAPTMRQQVLTKEDGGGYSPGITKG